MFGLLQLPRACLLNILSSWLVVQELCLVDTSVCSSEFRSLLIKLLKHEFIGVDGSVVTVKLRCYLKWLFQRGLHVRQLTLRCGSLQTFDSECLTPLKHLRELYINAEVRLHLHCRKSGAGSPTLGIDRLVKFQCDKQQNDSLHC